MKKVLLKPLMVAFVLAGIFIGATSSAGVGAWCGLTLDHLGTAFGGRPAISSFFRNYVINSFVADETGQKINIIDESKRSFTIQLKTKLGCGYTGCVYLATVDDFSLVDGYGEPVVIKIAHHLNGFKKSLRLLNQKIKDERTEFQLVDEAMKTGAIESDVLFPQGAWVTGRLPVVPILAVAASESGDALIKPLVTGMDLRQIYKTYGTNLPPEMIKSLRQIYALAQVIHKMVKRPGGGPFMLDIKAENLIWVSETADLANMGLKEPGFILFELSRTDTGNYLSSHLSFDQYLYRVQQALTLSK